MGNSVYLQTIKNNVDNLSAENAYRVHRGGSWHDVTWKQFWANIARNASALLASGIKEGDFVAIFAPNSPEWTELDFACMAVKAVTVAVHATCSQEVIHQIFSETSPKLTLVGNADMAEKLFAVANPEKVLIVEGTHPRCQTLADFLKVELNPEWDAKIATTKAEDLWTIVYTSGTTGEVRGAMLTHGNLMHQILCHHKRLPDVKTGDHSFCMLPLSHIFERGWSGISYAWGMTQHYFKTSPECIKLIPEAKPAVICVVPRILEKIYQVIQEKFSTKSAAMRRFVNYCVEIGCRYQAQRIEGIVPNPLLSLQNAIADRLVFSKIRAIFGGRIKHCVVGSASLEGKIHEFFRACGIFINCGYGLTETTATLSSTPVGMSRPGTVGLPMDGIELRFGKDNEIQVRGPLVMTGYYNKPEATQEVFTEDGFFRTGDVGCIDKRGYLCITDRLKDLIRTSTGKYVAPQFLENRLAMSPLIDQAAVVGEGRSWVGALLVPNWTKIEEYATQIGLAFSSREDLVSCPEIINFVKSTIDDLLCDVAKHERVQRIALLVKPFSIQTGELTPTLKLRRKIILEHYRDIIAAMDSWGQSMQLVSQAG